MNRGQSGGTVKLAPRFLRGDWDLKDNRDQSPISKKVLPLAKFSLIPMLSAILEACDDAPRNLLAGLAAVSHVRRYSRQVSAACFRTY